MKEYLKMEDAFSRKVDPITDWDEHGHEVRWITLLSHQAEHAAHAINSHDELVQMNQELLVALEDAATSLETIQLRSFGEDSFLDSKPEMRSYAGSRASVVRAAIAKAKGGAAK